MTNTSQIVHESETQRQFIRLQLPAQAEIAGKRYNIKDLSSGGLAIIDLADLPKKGDTLDFKLILPFADFSLDVDVEAEILYTDKKENVSGCRFINLNQNQVSILNHVIKSFIAGDIVDSNNILNVVSRDNFVNVRKHKNTDSPAGNLGQVIAYALISLITLALAFFIISNVIERMLIVKTSNANVVAQTVNINTPAAGTFKAALPFEAASVKQGELIGLIETRNSITSSEGVLTTQMVEVISPCDCFIADTYMLENQYGAENSPLFKLIPKLNNINVNAKVNVEDITKLQIGTTALMSIAGSKDAVKGVVTKITANKDAPVIGSEPFGIVTVKPEENLSSDLIDRPAFVEFKLNL